MRADVYPSSAKILPFRLEAEIYNILLSLDLHPDHVSLLVISEGAFLWKGSLKMETEAVKAISIVICISVSGSGYSDSIHSLLSQVK